MFYFSIHFIRWVEHEVITVMSVKSGLKSGGRNPKCCSKSLDCQKKDWRNGGKKTHWTRSETDLLNYTLDQLG